MATTLNNYADVQSLLNAFADANTFNIGGSPHGRFWNTLTYAEFTGTTPQDIFKPYPASVIVVPGSAATSPLIQVLTGGNGGTNSSIYPNMPEPSPPGYDANTPSQSDVITSLTNWITAGCPNNDDLTLIEGIGPKTHEVLKKQGITSFEQLAGTKAHKLREILDDAGLGSFDPGTWPAQANLAHNNETEALDSIQDHLKGGKAPAKEVKKKKETTTATNLNFRIHPAIGIARVGNSAEYYLGPETAAGDTSTTPSGGLPIKKGTESTTITSSEFRDPKVPDPNIPDPNAKDSNAKDSKFAARDYKGALKRQAARFKIYQYDTPSGEETYPLGPDATLGEIKIGSTVNGKTVKDIIWTVHLANKKAQFYQADPPYTQGDPRTGGGAVSFTGQLPPLRNPDYPTTGAASDDPLRLKNLFIDPGPRTISGQNTPAVNFDKNTTASYYNEQTKAVATISNYPKSFPDHTNFPDLTEPQGAITTLGELQTDGSGRLVVTGGYGRSANWGGTLLSGPVDNDGWFDDAGDGPVSAVIVLDDGTQLPVQGSAWVAVTDPSFAPQIKNVVSIWEDMYNSWVRDLRLIPSLYDGTSYNPAYIPGFDNQVSGVFEGAELQQWIGNLPPYPGSATGGDPHVGRPTTYNSGSPTNQFFTRLRDPNQDPLNKEYAPAGSSSPYMPLALGDNGQAFLSVTKTQYFFLSQWTQQKCNPKSTPLGPGELLDQNVLLNCLGGRFSPGIDLTWTVRQSELYIQDWENSGTGPFRIDQQPLNYSQITPDQAFLTEGYVPLHTTTGIQPGDLTKLMALPWHTDYNSCANHPTEVDATYPTSAPPSYGPPSYDDYSFWSWPAQRPVAAFTSKKSFKEKEQWFTLRGLGTNPVTDPQIPAPKPGEKPAPPYQRVCRYQSIVDIMKNWQNVGFILQSSVIDGVDPAYPSSYYLEAESNFPDGVAVPAWPNYLPDDSTS